MKLSLLVLLTFLLAACKQNNQAAIFGAWRTIVNSKYADNSLTDSVVFQKPDSLEIFMFQNKILVNLILGNFRVDKDKTHLTTEYEKKKFHFEIVELSDTTLQIREVGTKIFQRYRRLSH